LEHNARRHAFESVNVSQHGTVGSKGWLQRKCRRREGKRRERKRREGKRRERKRSGNEGPWPC
jgi:hypothetical protein